MICLDVDAALAEVPVNVSPLTDDTDFKSIETAVAYNAAGMALYWHFITCAGAYSATAVTPTSGGDYDWAHQQQGMYTIEIPASGGASINNDTEGHGWFTGFATGVLPWRGPTICFRASGLNDKLIESAYSATAGLAGSHLDAAVSGRASQTSVDDLPTNAELATALSTADDAVLSAIATVDTVVDAIQAKTDNLPSDPADQSLIIAATNTILADTNAILADTGTDGVVVAAASKTGYRLSATGVDDVLDEVVEGTTTLRQMIRGFASALLAKLSGAATTTVVARDVGDTKDRITATVDGDGNRSAVTLDLT